MPDVSILICVYGKLELTRKCLDAIAATAPEGRYEVIVVDNASPDGSGDALEALAPSYPAPLKVVRSAQNLGFVGGNNLAAQHASGTHLVLLNNDTEPQPGWLEALLDVAERPGVGAVGAKLVYPDGRLQEAGGIVFADASGWNYGRGGDPTDPRFNFVRAVDYCSGACLLVPRTVWDELGGFDERYAPAYYEDTDLCFAVRERGLEVVYQPAAAIVHREGATAGTDTASGFKQHQVVNRERFREKWAHALRAQQPPHPALVRRASHRIAGERLLVIDPLMPMFDRASGSRRLYELLLLLAGAGHAVTFVARECSDDAGRYRAPLEQAGIEVHDGDPDRHKQTRRARRLDLPALLAETRYDAAILAFHDLAAQYEPVVREHAPLTRVVVDSVDLHYVREQREAELTGDQATAARAAGTKVRELRTYARADAVLVVTDADGDALLAELPGADVHVVPNVHEPGSDEPASPGARDGLLFVGNFRHPPNGDAVDYLCREILPLVRRELPSVKLTIVGDAPPPAVQALAGNGVEVTGWVPETEPYLASHRLSVAPLRFGAGMKGKVGEALAHGLPVVTTSIGAEGMVETTAAASGLAVADDPEAFAAHIVRLVRDDAEWSRLAEAGRAHVARHYGHAPVVEALERLLAAGSTQPVVPGLTSIVILAHGELDLTEACVASIAAHTPEPHELILVDNASPDDTPAFMERYAAEHDNVRVVLNRRNAGFAAGSNLGLALSRGDAVLLLNNDTLVTPGWLGRMRDALAGDVALSGPLSNNVSGPQKIGDTAYGDPYADPAPLHAFAAGRAAEHAGELAAVPRVVGFCLLARRDAIERVGGLEERFGPGNFEDDDLCLRVQASGFGARIALDSFVHHEGSRTFATAKVDWTRAMIRNWTVFKELWGLPAEAPLEQGYEIRPEQLASPGRYVPLPALGMTHRTEDGRVFREDSQRVAFKHGVEAVSANEAAALRDAFAETARWGDVHHRYLTRRRLVQAVFDSGTRDPAMLAAAAAGLVAALEDNPREPVLLNELGVLFYGLGDGRTAGRLFEAARRLEPTLPEVDGNIAAARELAKVPRGRADRHAGVLRMLAGRAETIARRAVPYSTMRISLCMIVKDEEELLPRSLAAVAPYVDEIVIVDTGSTDGTVEIAKSFGAHVIDFPWNGSFADARNVSLDAATGDWILWLDADEVLDEESGELLREVATRSWREGFYLRMTSVLGDEDADGGFVHQTMRLFRNRPEYRFVGRIHEQHTGEMPLHIPERFEVTDIHVLHYGYGAERVAAREKGERNTSLLELEAAENDGDPFTLFNLGTEHLAAGRPLAAAEVLSAAWVTVIHAAGRPPQYLPSLATRLVQALRLAGEPVAALGAAEQALAIYADHTDIVREAALSARDNGELERAAVFAETCLELGDAPARYAGAIGAGTFLALGLLASIRSAQRRYDDAAALLQRSLAEYPSFTQARAALADVEVLRAGERLLEAAASGRPGDPAALAAARDAGVAAETLALYVAWRDGTLLPVESTPAALASLDRLLELQAFEAFESLAVVWNTSPLPERDRRELLAGVYMARGFLDSAAEEWLAVAAAEPTAPALTGLARVAHARGLADDARVLLEEALRLDPSSEEGRALRDVLASAA